MSANNKPFHYLQDFQPRKVNGLTLQGRDTVPFMHEVSNALKNLTIDFVGATVSDTNTGLRVQIQPASQMAWPWMVNVVNDGSAVTGSLSSLGKLYPNRGSITPIAIANPTYTFTITNGTMLWLEAEVTWPTNPVNFVLNSGVIYDGDVEFNPSTQEQIYVRKRIASFSVAGETVTTNLIIHNDLYIQIVLNAGQPCFEILAAP